MPDITSLWVFFQNKRKLINQILIGLIVFVAGWLAGQVTSPYYSSQPIIFQERGPGAVAGTSSGDLESLQQKGVEMRQQKNVQQVLADTRMTPGSGEYVASVNSNLFHHVSCAAAKSIKEENQIWFTSAEQARQAGYSPSKCTQEATGE